MDKSSYQTITPSAVTSTSEAAISREIDIINPTVYADPTVVTSKEADIKDITIKEDRPDIPLVVDPTIIPEIVVEEKKRGTSWMLIAGVAAAALLLFKK